MFSIDNSSFGFLNLFKKLGNLKFGNFDPLRMITASSFFFFFFFIVIIENTRTQRKKKLQALLQNIYKVSSSRSFTLIHSIIIL